MRENFTVVLVHPTLACAVETAFYMLAAAAPMHTV
jgi:hypothetical protein